MITAGFEVQVVYAGFWRRGAALVLDGVVDIAVVLVLAGVTGGTQLAPLAVAYLVIHHVGLGAEGGTIGKRMLGLRMTRTDGTRVSLGRSAVREIVRAMSTASLGLGYLWMLDDRQRRTWHDLAADTTVVRELRGDAAPPWRFNPPWLRAQLTPIPSGPAPEATLGVMAIETETLGVDPAVAAAATAPTAPSAPSDAPTPGGATDAGASRVQDPPSDGPHLPGS